MTPEGCEHLFRRLGIFRCVAGYFFAASSGVIGVATGAPPEPSDPGDGAAAAWFVAAGGFCVHPAATPLGHRRVEKISAFTHCESKK